jgi:hypothetical protein
MSGLKNVQVCQTGDIMEPFGAECYLDVTCCVMLKMSSVL